MIPPAPRSVIVLSSHVSASNVGGRVSAAVLSADGFEVMSVPTVVFGRHPGLGPPGGGPVPDAVFDGALEGLAATGAHRTASAILTGYFASPAQTEAAARFIKAARAANPSLVVLVDPISGDGPPDAGEAGLYVPVGVADALRDRLVPHADLLTPNAWELARLSGRRVGDADAAEAAARALLAQLRPGAAVAATSVPAKGRLGVVSLDRDSVGEVVRDALHGAPRGTGDLFAAALLSARLQGEDVHAAAAKAEARAGRAVEAAVSAGALDLSLDRAALSAPAPAAQPVWVMGLDGAPGGWAGVLVDLNGVEAPRARVFKSLQAALDAPEHAHVIAIDMPIGFAETAEPGGRACEREARARLGPRKSSVFNAPLRAALSAETYPEANAANRAAGGPGLSKQSWNLFPKLREVDAVMAPTLEGCVHECHPELSFALIAGAPMAHPKRTGEGRAERLAVLERQGLPRALFDPHSFPRRQAAADDLVDAGVLALSAARIARGEAACLPGDPPRDARGLRMAIFA